MRSSLEDLIEFPLETLENEYKGWIDDFSDIIVQAKIARHLAALANHGGGHLVFGFQDNLSLDPNRPPSLDKYNRDIFTSIVKHYLKPSFQCDVYIVSNKNGQEFPIVRIPGHGRIPIIAKAGGPHDTKGKPQGITASTYYIRKPGPESAPISDPQEWSELIKRCTLNDRERLLSDIASLFSPPEKTIPATQQLLENWHQEVEKRFLYLLSQAQYLPWPVHFNNHRYQLSYVFFFNAEEHPLRKLSKVLLEVNNEVLNTVCTGWSMFYPLNAPETAPKVLPERSDGTGETILETDLMDIRVTLSQDLWIPEFWRVAPDGRASLVRAYMEDRPYSTKVLHRKAGTWLSPETVIRETAELVTHAKWLAKQFETAAQVSFRCTWMGLESRELANFNGSDYLHSHKARVDNRTTERICSVVELQAKWSTVVTDLAEPVLRLFGFEYCSPDFVEKMKPEFIKL